MLVLGIESSCDDTGVALYDGAKGLLAHRLYSQIALHQPYGGVVPELASRDHIRKLLPLVEAVVAAAGVQRGDITAVAYTAGPGLAGALLVGAAFGRSLALALNVPAIGVHHMEAHLLSPLLEPEGPEFPFLALLVSGGHTLLADVERVGRYTILGESIDDAVGEAFDKTAKLLGLGYPGGPAIERLAADGRAGRFTFPRPMADRPGLDFSFSGLKTAVAQAVGGGVDAQTAADIARAFQDAAVDTLAIKCERALADTGHTRLLIAGGGFASVYLYQRRTGDYLSLRGGLQIVDVREGLEVLQFSGGDDAGDIVTVSSPNLPSFAVLQNLGSGNYRIACTPNENNEGRFNVTIVATDDKGASNSQEITIHVSDRNTRSVYVNLAANGNTMAGDPYNEYVGSVAGAIFNLKDEAGATTPFNFTLGGTIQGANTNGHITGNNSGIISDAALQAGIQTASTNPITVTFGGLNATKKYNIVFIGSANDGLPANVNFSATGVPTVSLNTRNNTTKSAQLNGLVPNGSGQITANMTKQAASSFAYLNAVILEEYTDTFTTSLMNPINLFVEVVNKNSVLLTWADRSNAETGYDVQRSTTSATAGFANIATNINATSYTDNSCNANTKYWYRVIARKTTAPVLSSDPSNVVVTITPETIVYVNFDFTFPEAAPWNNLNANPDEGKVFPNMLSDANVNTGITLEITKHFNGQFNAGMQTFGSGGIFPNNVMASNYWLDTKQVGQWKITNLNLSKRYRFGFFGSTGPGWFDGDFTNKYTIGNRTVYLNAHKNDSKVVYIGDVVPDANGEVLIDMSTTDNAAFGFTAALLIESYNDAVGGIVPNGINHTEGTGYTDVPGDKKNNVANNANSKPVITRISAYPNPFINNLSIDFYNNAAGNQVSVDIYDLTGRLVYRRNAGNGPVGPNTLRLNIENSGFTSGLYVVKLNINGQTVNTAKLVKSRQ